MNKLSVMGLTILVSSVMSTPTMAQSFSPSNTFFLANGQLTFVIGGPGKVKCLAMLDGVTGAGGSSVPDGSFQIVGQGGAPCPNINIGRTDYMLTSATATGGTGIINNASIYLSGILACSGSLPFTWVNNGSNPSTIQFDSNVGPCSVKGSLQTGSTDVNVVP
ncbi:MAG: hypothetical protein RIA72_15295 [Sphingopyxis sp.]|uniref:hypothetical protein n=1 Tax=Sphingopyxis sp. TaxID=1908224 RepID=UPI0032EFE882